MAQTGKSGLIFAKAFGCPNSALTEKKNRTQGRFGMSYCPVYDQDF